MALKRVGRSKGKWRIPGVCEYHGVKINEGGRDGETWLSGTMAADSGTKILLELVAIIT
jgi:hypothetical protein